MKESSTIRGFRQIIQDLLVPEFRVLQVKVDSNTAEIKAISEKIDRLTETTIRLVEQVDTSKKLTQVLERLSKVEQKLNL